MQCWQPDPWNNSLVKEIFVNDCMSDATAPSSPFLAAYAKSLYFVKKAYVLDENTLCVRLLLSPIQTTEKSEKRVDVLLLGEKHKM